MAGATILAFPRRVQTPTLSVASRISILERLELECPLSKEQRKELERLRRKKK